MQKNKFILGTAQFGLDYGVNNISGRLTKNEVFEILTFASENGILELDTADAYGNASELLGAFNKNNPRLFEINTKFTDKAHLEKQLANSLTTLQIDAINVYFYHNFNDIKNNPELLTSLLLLKQKNRIKQIGVSVYDNDEFNTVINIPEIDVIQFPFNLLDNRFQRGLLMKLAKEKGKELQVRSVFLQGLFFKPLDKLPTKLIPLKSYLKVIHNLSIKNQLAIEDMALLYAVNQSEIDYVIIGVDNMEQLRHNLNIGQQNMAPDLLEILNQIDVRETELLYPYNW